MAGKTTLNIIPWGDNNIRRPKGKKPPTRGSREQIRWLWARVGNSFFIESHPVRPYVGKTWNCGTDSLLLHGYIPIDNNNWVGRWWGKNSDHSTSTFTLLYWFSVALYEPLTLWFSVLFYNERKREATNMSQIWCMSRYPFWMGPNYQFRTCMLINEEKSQELDIEDVMEMYGELFESLCFSWSSQQGHPIRYLCFILGQLVGGGRSGSSSEISIPTRHAILIEF